MAMQKIQIFEWINLSGLSFFFLREISIKSFDNKLKDQKVSFCHFAKVFENPFRRRNNYDQITFLGALLLDELLFS